MSTPITTTPTVRLPHAEHGSGDGTPIVFLSGYSDSHESFARLMAELPEGVHAYALTHRGHGDAPKPDDGYDAYTMARDVVAFLDEHGIDRAVLCGHSLGSIIAARTAIDAPERVAGLVLMGGRPDWNDLDELFVEVAAFGDSVEYEWAEGFQQSTLARPIPEGMLEEVTAVSVKMPGRVWKALATAIRVDQRAELGSISAPTLLAWGEKDDFCLREHQDELLARIPDVRLIAYEGGGHAFHWEDPASFARDLAAFAAQVS